MSTEYKPEGRSNIRRLTPLECERLQSLPDNYTYVDNGSSIAQSDRYRWEMIGNGWTVDVIADIFRGMKSKL